jgi:mono/diheme cytochrome c family protein
MLRVKLITVIFFVLFSVFGCQKAKPQHYIIAESKAYEASLFRQNCAICHGREAEGKMLDDGRKVPSLRDGEFKAKTEAEIYNQIANGGNGMTPFRGQLSERELKLMAGFVAHDLRGGR